MSEARTDPVPGRPDRPPDPATPPPTAAGSDDILDEQVEPTDDAPTIISKNSPARTPSPGSDPSVPTDIRGRHLAHFELLEQIGVGGMAAVLRARDTQLDRHVALKILPPDMAADAENIRRFHQEARSAAKLDHENIARVFYCGEDQRLHFIAFEFVEGENLRTILERRGRLPVTEAVPFLIQIAAGLCHAAERGVVHRDIKPSNIIITPNGRAKLVDMGLARSLEPHSDRGLTHSGVTLGTFDYISPEQALEPRDADVRSDIYSLGCTFYHMVTGRAPVPEGTAARKLHHHQHVKPTDPRELVVGLPDEIAVILDRMMAKDPKDRYQTADDLLRHLLLAAKKIGATPDVPEGVLFVEAALTRPQGGVGPVLLGALAVAAVVALIFLIDSSGQPPSQKFQPSQNNKPEDPGVQAQKDKGAEKPAVKDGQKDPQNSNPVQPAEATFVVEAGDKTDNLVQFLRANKGAQLITIELDRDIDLVINDESDPTLTITARKVHIKPKTPGGKMPMVRLRYNGRPLGEKNQFAALVIESPESLVEGIRVVVDGRGSSVELAGLVLRGGSKHRVQNCEFIQSQPGARDEKRMPAQQKQLASLVVEPPLAGIAAVAFPAVPAVTLKGCTFLSFAEGDGEARRYQLGTITPRAQDAVVRLGPASFDVDNCAFGPHSSQFRLFATEKGNGKVKLQHCTLIGASRSTIFDLEDRADALFDVQYTLFANPTQEAEDDGSVLVRQNQPGEVRWDGHDNRYSNLAAFWISTNEVGIDFTDFADKLREKKRGQDDSRVLKTSPWSKPESLPRLLEEQNLVAAFRVEDTLRELRQTDSMNQHLIGVEGVNGTSYVKNLPLVEIRKPEPMARKERIVVPGVEDSGNLIYPSLNAAVETSQPGDIILIRHTGELAAGPLVLVKPNLDLTIRPERGSRPVLVLGDTADQDAFMFCLHDGKLRLEGLELRLRPKEGFKAQTLLAMKGDGVCSFKDCLATFEQAGRLANLSLATVHSLSGVMKMEPKPNQTPGQTPLLTLDNCFVRGQGDLIWSRSSRPFKIDANNTLVALSGSFLNVQLSSDTPPPAPGHEVVASLKKVTTYLGGYLVHWRAVTDLKGVVPFHCQPTDCAFLPATTRGSLLHLEGPETDMDKLKDKLVWDRGRNAYGQFEWLFDQEPAGEASMPGLNPDRWRDYTKDDTSKFNVKLAVALAADAPFQSLVPSKFKLMDLAAFGVELESLLKLFPPEVEPDEQ
jgi:serine/threonine protein kinase